MKIKCRGFTVIELLIVLVIMGIILAIVLPSYTDYVRKAARADAKSAVLDLAQNEERYFTNNGSYLAVAAPPATTPTGWKNYSGADSPSGAKYHITVAAGATTDLATSFLITASPANSFTDPVCGTLTVDSNGTRSSSVAGSNCW